MTGGEDGGEPSGATLRTDAGGAVSATDLIGRTVTVEVDRPLGSRHPSHGLVYEVNNGFVPGLMAPDGEFQDAYVLGPAEPLGRFTGTCIAVIHRLDDNEDKLIVAAPGADCADEQIRRATEFQERFFRSVLLRR